MISTPPPLPPATSSKPTPKPLIIPAIKTDATTESTIGVFGIGIMLANILIAAEPISVLIRKLFPIPFHAKTRSGILIKK